MKTQFLAKNKGNGISDINTFTNFQTCHIPGLLWTFRAPVVLGLCAPMVHGFTYATLKAIKSTSVLPHPKQICSYTIVE